MSTAAKTKTIPALEARTNFGEIMKEVQGGRVRVLVEKAGVPMVGIISADEFRRLITEREVRFGVVDRIRARVPRLSDDQIGRDVASAVKSVRQRRRRA